MNTQIEDIIDQLFNKYHGVSRDDINRMIKSQFKLTQEVINERSNTVVNWMYLGKIKPTPFRVKQLKIKEIEQVSGNN